MKQRLGVFYLVLLFSVLGVFSVGQLSVVAAQGDIGDSCPCKEGLECDVDGNFCYASLGEGPQTPGQIYQIVKRVGEFLFVVFMLISVVFVAWGGFWFVFAQGEPAKVMKARDQLMWAVVGIGLALLAVFADDLLQSLLEVQ
ncbi:MAG: hypothetical protein A3A27_01800 [Candidatus Wildermuthbacteria bacterium RIFCSPLOWO2_01_FULL_47_18]|uniref:Uncharacterized protein n=1 Tax=Candidatus Wildermuthbacteria bacterium RIFCSPLOWO2_01_FULL_47_18 TaxID=1802460 RepID=A0A1G2RHW3_9BACT|nr:MAG: hypothetical protein A3A27_01800 [Candidatus Wildermuthbacteria bacterium RIFCSPLOWO2_01_FULL_47_18]